MKVNQVKTIMDTERKDTIIWKYKMANGIMYKRKYNTTTNKWVGSWIRC